MREPLFWTSESMPIPAVTAEQMREVDRIAVEEFGLGILQMMENAGRNLAANVVEMLAGMDGEVTVLAGAGGNGGGGLCAARHLHNRGYKVNLILDREASALGDAAANQLRILQVAGLRPVDPSGAEEAIRRADVVVDALIGYSLRGAPRGRAAELIALCNGYAKQVLSLDVPSGLDATTGDTPGAVVHPDRTLTLALPKTGLAAIPEECLRLSGELYLADIGIPPEVYESLGLSFKPFFQNRYWIPLQRQAESTPDK
ncbi:MAG: NAD(P)H-hydrate epimerase [Anaerolineae bacterium]|nr:NAD(P)H-hydrate epimerase [Anaerolineae bacterium]